MIPALSKQLKKPATELQAKPILNIPTGKEQSHIVIKLPEADGNKLLKSGKILLGFYSCSIQHFLTIMHCYKCQRFDHLARNCKFSPALAESEGEHPTGGGPDNTPICNRKPKYQLHSNYRR